MPCPFTVSKIFCAGPNFLSQPKTLTAFSASSKKKTILLNANHLFVWHKMFVTAVICKYIFGWAQKIWTSPKHFWTCESSEIGCWICGARYKWLDYFIYHESWLPTNPASFAILKKADWRFLSKFWGESNSRIFPAARTITLELSMMVFNRWAMVKTVQSAKWHTDQ